MPASTRGLRFSGVLCALLALGAVDRQLWAATPTPQQRALARSAEAAVKKGANLYRSKKFADAAEALREAQTSLDELAADDSPAATALSAPLLKQVSRARELLEAEGVKLPPAKAPAGGKTSAKVSFTRQVAPLLVAKCAACHIQRSRGGFSMGSYVALAKGSQNGTVIMTGDAQGSRIIELLENGDMPRGGGKFAPEELMLVTAWINEGAKFDGPDSAAPLISFASPKDSAKDAMPKLTVVAATGREEVQFARDVAPTLVAHCAQCHAGDNPRNNFSIETFTRLLQGGDSGPVLAPGKPEASLIIKKLRGMAGARMPLDASPLDEPTIAKIEKWISLGTKFDGADPDASLEDTIALVIAQHATHEQLTRTRTELAAKNWRLIVPDAKPRSEETPNVLVYGSVGPEILAEVARTADEQVVKLRKLFKVPADQPLIKGRLTLYVFDKRYDYGEVGTMLEHREIPSSWRGHWRYTVVDAYGCVLLSSDGNAAPGLIAQQIAGAYVAGLGAAPRWFAEGTARVVAAKFDSKDPRVKLWDDQVGRILTASDKPEAFLNGGLSPEDNDILSYSFVKYLNVSGPRQSALLAALQQGTAFDEAFAKIYNGPPSQLIDTWTARAAKRGR